MVAASPKVATVVRLSLTILAALAAGSLASGCSSGNVRSASSYNAPAAPPVKNPLYDPYGPYASANATWRAPIYNQTGTIVRVGDPNVDRDRPPYEQAPWATGADARRTDVPPGTF